MQSNDCSYDSMKRIIPFLVRGATLAVFAVNSFAAEPRPPERYCNPLPIPDYPVGKLARDVTKGEPNDGGLWIVERKEQYRELAGPTALWFEGAWYLYPSCDMAWVSRDEGRTWPHAGRAEAVLSVAASVAKPQAADFEASSSQRALGSA